MVSKECPCGRGCMNLTSVEKSTVFKGIDLRVESEKYVCPHCGIEAGTLEQASAIQHCIAETYRQTVGLLTGGEIQRMRKNAGLTREQLSILMEVAESDIKGWESCLVQSRSVDKTLRMILKNRGSYEIVSSPDLPDE